MVTYRKDGHCQVCDDRLADEQTTIWELREEVERLREGLTHINELSADEAYLGLIIASQTLTALTESEEG